MATSQLIKWNDTQPGGTSTMALPKDKETSERRRPLQPTIEDHHSDSSEESTSKKKKVNFAIESDARTDSSKPSVPSAPFTPPAYKPVQSDSQSRFSQATTVFTAETTSNAPEGDPWAFTFWPKVRRRRAIPPEPQPKPSSRLPSNDRTINRPAHDKTTSSGEESDHFWDYEDIHDVPVEPEDSISRLRRRIEPVDCHAGRVRSTPRRNTRRGAENITVRQPLHKATLGEKASPIKGPGYAPPIQTLVPFTGAGYTPPSSTFVPYPGLDPYAITGIPWHDPSQACPPAMQPPYSIGASYPVTTNVHNNPFRPNPAQFRAPPPECSPPPPPPDATPQHSLLTSLEKLLLAKEEQDRQQQEDAKFRRLESLLLNVDEARLEEEKTEEARLQADKAAHQRVVDPIELVETYLDTVRQVKERELLEANRVLSWIEGRRSHRDKTPERPNVESYLVYDENSELSESEGIPTQLSSSTRTTVPVHCRKDLSTRRVSFQEQLTRTCGTESLLQETACSSTRSLYSGNTESTESPIQPYRSPPTSQCAMSDGLSEVPEASSTVANRDILPPNHTGADKAQPEKEVTEVDALRQHVAVLKHQLNRTSQATGSSLLGAIHATVRKRFRRKPPSGTQRLEWTCECGEELFADLPLTDHAQYHQMLAFLTSPPSTAHPSGQDSSTPPDLEAGIAASGYSSPTSNQGGFNFGNGKASTSTFGSSNTFVGSSRSQSFAAQPDIPYPQSKYLELCVNVGKYETNLAEIQVTSSSATGSTICTDAHLFRKIYDRYHALRKQTWRRFLFRPAGVKFVHFGVQAESRVGFFAGDPLPTKEVVAAKRYEFNLQPPVPPPIDSRTFLHYFWKHSKHARSRSARYVDRLPKKLGESLVRSIGIDELREGWGIHIVERPNKAVICWTLFVVLLASFGVSVGYGLLMKQVDSGFGIGQWMVAALSVMLTAVFFSLEDEVSTGWD